MSVRIPLDYVGFCKCVRDISCISEWCRYRTYM